MARMLFIAAVIPGVMSVRVIPSQSSLVKMKERTVTAPTGKCFEANDFSVGDVVSIIKDGATVNGQRALIKGCGNTSVTESRICLHKHGCWAPASLKAAKSCVDGFLPVDTCVSPFKHNKIVYEGCVKDEDGGAWCSTNFEYRRGQWEHCEPCTDDFEEPEEPANSDCQTNIDCRSPSCAFEGSVFYMCMEGKCKTLMTQNFDIMTQNFSDKNGFVDCEATPKIDYNKCVAGYRPPPACADIWSYKGNVHTGCTSTDDFFGRQWCSREAEYNSGSEQYSLCEQCTEEPATPIWEPVSVLLRSYQPIVMEVGTPEGPLYTYAHKGMTFDKALPSASIGKWLGVVAISGCVQSGHLTWDSLASDVFDWWTKDSKDTRSRVTLRSLLTFTSGFETSSFTHEFGTQTCLNANGFYTPEECAKQIYDTANHSCEPGRCLDYNSFHQNLAMSMAVKAMSMDAREIIKKYLIEPAGLTDTWWLGGQNPFMSGGIVTSARDLVRFLKSYITYTIAPQAIIEEIDTEYAQAHNVTILNGMPFTPKQHFGMSHEARPPVHFWAGAFKAECWIDRSTNVYMMAFNGDLIEGLIDPQYPYVLMGSAPGSVFGEVKDALKASGITLGEPGP